MNWLEELCISYNVTRYQLSKSTGISQSYLSKIVNEDISFRDIKVSQYLAIIDFFKLKKIQPSTAIPHCKFERFYEKISLYNDFYEKFVLGSISSEEFSSECFRILTSLSAYSHSMQERGEVLYVCSERAYFDAIVKK